MTSALHLPDRREWTIDDLAELSDDFRYELINGRLVVTSPILPHQDLSVRVLLALEENCPPGIAPAVELSIKIDRHNQPRPDVVAVKLDHTDRTPVPVEDVVLVVEILSKENTLTDIQEKQRSYARAGVPHYWVINPLRGRLTLNEQVLDPDRRIYYSRTGTAGVFQTEQPWPARLDLPALTKRYESRLPPALQRGDQAMGGR